MTANKHYSVSAAARPQKISVLTEFKIVVRI